MNTATSRRIVTQKVEDLHRLADQGERNGVRILVEPISGEHFATSATSPILYRVSVDGGCGCKGYQVWQRCQHFALLLSELGLIPDLEPDVVLDEQPAPVVTHVVTLEARPAPCRTCRGEGFTKAYIGGRLADWVGVPCRDCTARVA